MHVVPKDDENSSKKNDSINSNFMQFFYKKVLVVSACIFYTQNSVGSDSHQLKIEYKRIFFIVR